MPGSSQGSLIDTPYYHCVSRCVRRAFLCGTDKYSGTSYEHRRAWVVDKVLWLSSVFAIGICAYAVMSNHVHLVLCVDKDKAMSWSDKQVVGRWHRLHIGTLLSQKFMRNEPIRFIRRAMDNPDYRIRTTLLLCSGCRADDASIQNPYPQKANRWDEAGQTTAIIGIPNKHLPCFVLFKLKRTKYA
jgi:REP element-mobilizing transposase RayT